MRRFLLAAACLAIAIATFAGLGIAAHADTPTVYQPSNFSKNSTGYYETHLDVNRLRVVFTGEAGTDRETVEANLLYRAAEVTVQRGFDSFTVVDHAVDTRTETQRKGPPLPIGPKRETEVTRYTASSEIIMFKGKPADQPTAYDARVTQTNLQYKVTRR